VRSNAVNEQHLGQLYIGRLRFPLDDPRMADFVDNLARVNVIADRAEGFVWRLQDDGGNATNFRPYHDPRIAINMSVWAGVEALERYVWQTVHRRFYTRRGEWFEKFEGPYFVMWWVPAGHRPTIQEAMGRLDHLKQHGSTQLAFGWDSLPAAQLWKTARCA
jgi:Domain of unknown function (DUF3291)